MHSATMDRFRALTDNANISIGSDFRPIQINSAETDRKLTAYMKKKGVFTLSRQNRLMGLYRKWKLGLIPKDIAVNVLRDHKEEFAKFDKLKLMPA